MSQSTSSGARRPIERLRTAVDLLENTTLARIYVYVRHADGATVDDLVTHLEIPQGTAYDYVQRLETGDILTKTRSKRPYEYEAEPLSVTITVDGDQRTITAELVDAVARTETNEDLEVYRERHGIDGLATALEYAQEFVDGTVNARIAARELDCSVLEAEIILQALESIVLDHRDDE